MSIRVPGPEVPVGALSGGNQQKVLLSRLLETRPRVLLLDEPTRGVDIGAKSEIYRIIDQLAQQGAAVLVISSDLPEIVGIAEIDTRKLTRILRDTGAQHGCLVAGHDIREDDAIAAARAFPGLKGMDLAKVVSVKERYSWREGSYDLDKAAFVTPPLRFRVVAFDYGIKTNILRMLVDRGCDVTIVPAQTPASEVIALRPDGVLLANGPGDPEPCGYAITAIRELIRAKVPTFGICLGHQLLGLALGAKTLKMKFGHHGANHPVIDLATGRVMISSQNHGFAVDEATLPANAKATHRSLFDGSLQGIRLTDAPVFSFQGHPEASPGPHDVAGLFDQFIELMEARAAAAA